ncbi:MAG: hypothetical protein IJU52_09920 [Clostridia bacterium]|nr:hypothetical protein [Clostridia bacterium]
MSKRRRTMRELRRDIYTEPTEKEQEKLIDQSLKLGRPKFTSRLFYSALLFFGVLLMATLGDLPTEAVWAIVGIGVAVFIALWVSYAVKVRKYRKWYKEQYEYLSAIERSDNDAKTP